MTVAGANRIDAYNVTYVDHRLGVLHETIRRGMRLPVIDVDVMRPQQPEVKESGGGSGSAVEGKRHRT